MEPITSEPIEAIEPITPEATGDPIEPVEGADPALEGGEPIEAIGDVKGDARTLPGWVKALQSTDPQGYKAARDNFFAKQTLDRKLDGMDVDAVVSYLNENGGLDGVTGRLTELAQAQTELQSIREGIATGNPKILDDLVSSSPEGFSALAPAVMERYAQVDPEGYNANLSQIFSATINSGGIPMHLERQEMLLGFLADAIGDNPRALQIAQQLSTGVGGLKNWMTAFSQVQAPQRQQPGMQKQGGKDGQQEWQQEKAQFEQQQYQTSLEKDLVEPTRQKEITAHLSSFFKKRPDDKDAQELALQNVRQQVLQRMNADKDFVSKVAAFHSRRDGQGAAKLIASREKAAIAEISQKVGRTIFGAVPAGQPAAVPGGQQQQRPALPQKPTSRSEILRAALA